MKEKSKRESPNDRGSGWYDATRPNVRMHSRGCIWLPVTHARAWILDPPRDLCLSFRSRVCRHVPLRRRWRQQRATTIMGYRYCGLSWPRESEPPGSWICKNVKKRFPQTIGRRECLVGLIMLARREQTSLPLSRTSEHRERRRIWKATGQIQDDVFWSMFNSLTTKEETMKKKKRKKDSAWEKHGVAIQYSGDH